MTTETENDNAEKIWDHYLFEAVKSICKFAVICKRAAAEEGHPITYKRAIDVAVKPVLYLLEEVSADECDFTVETMDRLRESVFKYFVDNTPKNH